MGKIDFNRSVAFDRNIGWLTQREQESLSKSVAAIAGVGGAGGYQAQALARLGVRNFHIADLDRFEMTNFNRQIGAGMSTLGEEKTEVMRRMILDINPNANVKVFSDGINEGNVGDFLKGVDLAFDGVDFFEIDVKRLLFSHCRKLGVPALTCGPFGFGATLLIFKPKGMSFDAYFDFKEGMTPDEKRLAMLAGLNPAPFCVQYMDAEKVLKQKERRGASVCPGLMLVGAMSATAAVKILAGKGKVRYAPHIYQVDLFTQQSNQKVYRCGMKSPWQRLKKRALKLRLRSE